MAEQLKAHRGALGWAFLLAWVFCVFYTGSLDGLSHFIEAQTSSLAERMLYSMLPVGSAVVTLIVAVAAERRVGPPTKSHALMIASPIVTALATPVFLTPIDVPGLSQALFLVTAIATGVGSGIMWLAWGELYARLPQDAVETCAPVSAVIATALSFAVFVVPEHCATAIVSLFPLISGIIFWKSWPHAKARAVTDYASAPAKPASLRTAATSMGRTGFGIFAACFFVSIEGSFWASSHSNALETCIVFVAAAVFMIAVSISATAGPRRVSLSFAYRWMCPLMVAGFAAIIVFGAGAGTFLAATVGIASRFAFCLITQMYFAAYAARGHATAVQSYGMGWLFVHVGDLLGVAVSVPLRAALDCGAATLANISAVAIVLLVFAIMVVLNGENRFLNWKDASLENVGAACDAQSLAAGAVAAPAQGLQAGSALSDRSASVAATSPASSSLSASQASADSHVADAAAESIAADASAESTFAAVSPTAAESEQVPAPIDPLAHRIAALAAEYKLTRRETEVFGLLAHGRSIPYVRDALFISKDTAATHAKHIYAKLGVHSRQELIDLVTEAD